MSDWISVDERLPEKFEHNHFSKSVLGYCSSDKCQYVVCYSHEMKCWVYFESVWNIVHGGISDWRELPEPPKKPEAEFNTKQEG